jgi:hypothetical protein
LNFHAKTVSRIREEVEKSVTATLSLIIFVCGGVSAGYGKNVTDFGMSECATENVSVNPLQKSDMETHLYRDVEEASQMVLSARLECA